MILKITTAVTILLFLPYSCQVIIRVDTCPSNKQSWQQRSSNFFCENQHEEYHCILDHDTNLIETCMLPQIISSFKVGCPWVQIIRRKTYLGNPFNPCNATQDRCPGKFHERYRTNQLYIYPACITYGGFTGTKAKDGFTIPNPSTLLTDLVRERTSTKKSYGSIVALVVAGLIVITVSSTQCICMKKCTCRELERNSQGNTEIRQESLRMLSTKTNSEERQSSVIAQRERFLEYYNESETQPLLSKIPREKRTPSFAQTWPVRRRPV